MSANDKKDLVGNFSLFVIASPSGRGNPLGGAVSAVRASAGLPRRAVALLAMTRCGLRRGDKGGEARAFGGREKEFSERKEGFGGQKSFSGGRKILSGALASHLDEEERCFNGLKRLSRAMFPFCHCEPYRAWQSSRGVVGAANVSAGLPRRLRSSQ
jgi:hypothetical protein